MAYFPLFVSLEGWRCLVVGGGKVAFRKAQALADYGGKIFVISETFCAEWEEWSQPDKPVFIYRKANVSDAKSMDLVVCASSNTALHREISQYCRKKRIPVNVADSREESSFLFPALIRQDSVVLGITTGGESPAVSHYLREQISAQLPPNLGKLAKEMGDFRQTVKEALPVQKEREQVFYRLLLLALEKGSLDEALVKAVIAQEKEKNQ